MWLFQNLAKKKIEDLREKFFVDKTDYIQWQYSLIDYIDYYGYGFKDWY